jgi:hypothetical protein
MKTSMLLSISISLNDLFVNDVDARMAIIGDVDDSRNSNSTTSSAEEVTKVARVAFADYVARHLYAHLPITDVDYDEMAIEMSRAIVINHVFVVVIESKVHHHHHHHHHQQQIRRLVLSLRRASRHAPEDPGGPKFVQL